MEWQRILRKQERMRERVRDKPWEKRIASKLKIIKNHTKLYEKQQKVGERYPPVNDCFPSDLWVQQNVVNENLNLLNILIVPLAFVFFSN